MVIPVKNFNFLKLKTTRQNRKFTQWQGIMCGKKAQIKEESKLLQCDRTNLGGTSRLCALVGGPFNPAPWMAIAQEDFKNANQTIPWYLNTDSSRISKDSGAKRFTNRRLKIADERKKSNLIFLSESLQTSSVPLLNSTFVEVI